MHLFRSGAVLLCCVLIFGALPAFGGYEVQVNTVSDFGNSFHRVAILPCPAAEGVDPLWVESLLFEKLTARRIKVVPSQLVRQILFDLGATAVTAENKGLLAEKLKVDAFVIPTVGAAKTDTVGTVAVPMYGGASSPRRL